MTDFHILALETSSTLCTVALLTQRAGTLQLFTARAADRATRAEQVLPMIQEVLVRADLPRQALTAVAFGQGPGGFTGLRVACSVAQGLAVALDIPVLPVDSLCAIAFGEAGEAADGIHLVLQDARMQEIYAAAYRVQDGRWTTLQAPVLLARAEVGAWASEQSARWAMQAGGGWTVHGDALTVFAGLADELVDLGGLRANPEAPPVHARAASVARLALRAWQAGLAVDAAQATPAYVRDKVAYTSLERARGLGGNPQAAAGMQTVHAMRVADLHEVAAIERQVQSFPWTWRNFADGLAAGNHGWVVRRLGAMLGFALVMDAPDMAHLLVIGVRPDAQRRGVGGQLLAQCIAHCRQAGRPALTLEVRRSNAQAIRFYEQHGFRQVGVRRGYYPAPHNQREDAWIMTLDLVMERT